MSVESIQLYNAFVALLSLVALAGAISLASYRMWRGPDAASVIPNNVAFWLAWTVATTATLGSLFYSEVIHFPPCELCWFQRILASAVLASATRLFATIRAAW